MNIFALDPCPIRSALFIPFPKPGVALIKESCQMLATNVSLLGGPTYLDWTHVNHPCTKWARETKANYSWLLTHADYLQLCYEERYKRTHDYASLIFALRTHVDLFPDGPLTPHVLAMPPMYRQICIYESYKNFLASKPYLKGVSR